MITYREYEDRDWKAICQIHDLARPDEPRGSCDPRAFVPIEQDKEVEELRACHKFVACVDKQVVGFVGVDGNQKAIKLYESEGFQAVKRFTGDNAGYLCSCLRLERP